METLEAPSHFKSTKAMNFKFDDLPKFDLEKKVSIAFHWSRILMFP